MAKLCPLTNKYVVYLECQDCDDKTNCKDIQQNSQKELKENNKDHKYY